MWLSIVVSAHVCLISIFCFLVSISLLTLSFPINKVPLIDLIPFGISVNNYQIFIVLIISACVAYISYALINKAAPKLYYFVKDPLPDNGKRAVVEVTMFSKIKTIRDHDLNEALNMAMDSEHIKGLMTLIANSNRKPYNIEFKLFLEIYANENIPSLSKSQNDSPEEKFNQLKNNKG